MCQFYATRKENPAIRVSLPLRSSCLRSLFADSVGNQTGTVDLSGTIGDGAVRVSVTSDVLDWTKTNTCGGHFDGDFRQRHDL